MVRSLFVDGRDVDIERKLAERRQELSCLRRAAAIARRQSPPPDASAERRLFAHAQLARARQALACGDLHAVHGAARTLRVTDFEGDTDIVEGLLGVVRDSRSDDEDVRSAIDRLCEELGSAEL